MNRNILPCNQRVSFKQTFDYTYNFPQFIHTFIHSFIQLLVWRPSFQGLLLSTIFFVDFRLQGQYRKEGQAHK